MTVTDNFLPDDHEEEKWKIIDGYEGYYEVSDKGRIKSVERYVYSEISVKKRRRIKSRIIKLRLNSRGQQLVGLSKENLKDDFLVSRLVAIAFIPNPMNLPDVDHKKENKDKTDNSVSNLQWTDKRNNSNKYFRETGISREFTGVKKAGEKFQCSIRIKGKEYYVGTYSTAEEASETYNKIANDESLLESYRKTRNSKGVCFIKKTNKWAAYLYKNKIKIHLGFYKSEEEAISAVLINKKNNNE